jgi:hypothetical protein
VAQLVPAVQRDTIRWRRAPAAALSSSTAWLGCRRCCAGSILPVLACWPGLMCPWVRAEVARPIATEGQERLDS